VRILTVGLLYPPHYLGGYELICDGVMRAARSRGHDIQILTSNYHASEVDEPDYLPVDRTLRTYLDETVQHAVKLKPAQRLRLERANAGVLDRHLRAFSPDVVNWWGMGGMSLSMIERVRRRGIASVLVIQDSWLSYGFQIDGWTRMTRRLGGLAPLLELLYGIPARYRLEEAGRFLFNSEHTFRAALAAGVDPPDSAVVTPGVHPRYLVAAPSKRWDWRLLHVGRIDRDKGIDIAVAALVHLPPQARLTVAGAGDPAYETELRRQAKSLGVGDRVDFIGRTASEALPSLYAAADAVLFPIRWEEPWGLVPLEAMGIGRPVVATARGGAATYLRDGENALLIPSDNPQALAASIRLLADDDELRARLHAGGLLTAAEHSAPRYERRILDELERAALEPSSSRTAR
jgi:glycosyltransferase involved in cell wall biosynthesis